MKEISKTYLTLTALLLVFFLSGCEAYREARQERKARETIYRYPEKFAIDFSRLFPVKDSVIVRRDTITNTIYLPGGTPVLKPVDSAGADTSRLAVGTFTGTITVSGAGILVTGKSGKAQRVECPQVPCPSQTIIIDSSHFQRDIAREAAYKKTEADLTKQVQEVQTKLQGKTEGNANWRMAAIATWLLLLVALVIYIATRKVAVLK